MLPHIGGQDVEDHEPYPVGLVVAAGGLFLCDLLQAVDPAEPYVQLLNAKLVDRSGESLGDLPSAAQAELCIELFLGGLKLLPREVEAAGSAKPPTT